jgi:hemolysin activation/secretion protein
MALIATLAGSAAADGAPEGPPAAGGAGEGTPPAPARSRRLDLLEFRVEGVHHLGDRDLHAAVEPFLGPGRDLEDVEKARAAVEKAYSDKGYLAVTVAIPPQTVRDGVVTLQVTEGRIGHLRVSRTEWFSPFDIRKQAPSVAEGTVPNLNDIVRDIAALNQLPDRRVTPALRAGEAPGTIDVDLNVQETLPLHGSLELNNRYSANTTPLRVNGSIRYDNLWQAGHTLGFAFQIAPQRLADGEVFSVFYNARIPGIPWLGFGLNAVIQDSDVSTLGSVAARGKGQIVGLRANFTLPGSTGFYQSLSAGIDYKHFAEGLTLGADRIDTPITYWPVTAQYGASWTGDISQTMVTATLVTDMRGLSSNAVEFDAKRYKSSGAFVYLRGEVSHTEGFASGLQLFGKAQGQISGDPLVASEQYTVGGVDSVRGYLEVTAAGDFGAAGTLEARSPSVLSWMTSPAQNDWRFHVFTDAGWAGIFAALPGQLDHTGIWSAGAGTRIRMLGHLGATLDVGLPLLSSPTTERFHPRIQFRVWGDL